MRVKDIKKALFKGKIRLSAHTMERMEKRGYTKSDLISCIMGGEITEVQLHDNALKVLIEGVDTDNLPIVVSIGRDKKAKDAFSIITVMPPINPRFKRVI